MAAASSPARTGRSITANPPEAPSGSSEARAEATRGSASGSERDPKVALALIQLGAVAFAEDEIAGSEAPAMRERGEELPRPLRQVVAPRFQRFRFHDEPPSRACDTPPRAGTVVR